YGEDHVSQIVTFGTLAPRAAVRDVGRALGMSYADVDRVAAKIGGTDDTIADALKRPELAELYASSEEVRRLIDVAMKVEGMPRHASTHAAGVVITKDPVSEYVPLAVSGDVVVTQFDMDTVALLGLVKFDFLGIRYLSVIEETEGMIRRRHPDFDLVRIDYDDPAIYKMISAGQTLGVFQLEKSGMRQVLRRLKPTCFEDLIAVIALYRPGPMDQIDTFIRRKHGEEPITYEIPELEQVLQVTYGCIVYQEQVMQIFSLLADYSLARADLVRRAISKKKADVLEKERNAFLEGTARHGIDPKKATALFDEIAAFADYAFNRNHAAAYAMLVYRTAYLKAKYPREYMAALMSSVLGRADKLAEYAAECSRQGIRVLPPDIATGETGFSVSRDGIRFGLLAVKGVGKQFLDAVIDERERRPVADFADINRRMSGRELNRRQVEALIKCGALDCFGETRKTLIASCEDLIAAEQMKARSTLSGQIDFFSLGGEEVAPKTEYARLPEYEKRELIAFERDAIGMSFSGNALDDYSDDEQNTPHTSLSELRRDPEEDENDAIPEEPDGKTTVTVVGVISDLTEKETRNGDRMAFVTLCDRTGEIGLIVFPKLYRQYGPVLRPEAGVAVTGEIDPRDGAGAKILVRSVRPLRKNGEVAEQTLYLRVPSLSSPEAERTVALVKSAPGPVRVVFYDLSKKTYANYTASGVAVGAELLSRLTDILGEGSVVLR
ncbi:MAG: DNA polymerase III subunit alpha, partial [Clostridia bacterium]|nr:DNA polymerase III subunit alpha [Clostridia bacterium]